LKIQEERRKGRRKEKKKKKKKKNRRKEEGKAGPTSAVDPVSLIPCITGAVHTRSSVSACSSPNCTDIVGGIGAVTGADAVGLRDTVIANAHIASDGIDAIGVAEANSRIEALVDVWKGRERCNGESVNFMKKRTEERKRKRKEKKIAPVQFTPLPVKPVVQLQ